jgi:hypothetical protein
MKREVSSSPQLTPAQIEDLKSSPVGVLGKEISQALDKHGAAVGDPVKVANSLCAHLVTYIAQHSGGDYPKKICTQDSQPLSAGLQLRGAAGLGDGGSGQHHRSQSRRDSWLLRGELKKTSGRGSDPRIWGHADPPTFPTGSASRCGTSKLADRCGVARRPFKFARWEGDRISLAHLLQQFVLLQNGGGQIIKSTLRIHAQS